MILYQTPEHKHEWTDKGSAYGIEEGRRVYIGILFVCSCGKKEVDCGVTTRVLASLVQITLNDLPDLFCRVLGDSIKRACISGHSMTKLSVENGGIVWEFLDEKETKQS